MQNILTQKQIESIDELCRLYNISSYQINNDGTVDVDGGVNFQKYKFSKLPIKFNKVNGSFYVANNNLVTLEGAPNEVSGHFLCHENQLQSLEFCPTIVGGNMNCGNNLLSSLEGCPQEVGGYFDCHYNRLTSLMGSPIIGGEFVCSYNQLSTLEGCPILVDAFYFHINKFPEELDDALFSYIEGEYEEAIHKLNTFVKYQDYFDIWTDNGFDKEAFFDLISEIEEGLL